MLMSQSISAFEATKFDDGPLAKKVSFGNYPVASRECLYKAYRLSNCSEVAAATHDEVNNCLCSNGDEFIDHTARCLRDLDSHTPIVEHVWNTMVVLCVMTDTPIDYPVLEFVRLGSGVVCTSESRGRGFDLKRYGKVNVFSIGFILGCGCPVVAFMLFAMCRLVVGGTRATRDLSEKQDIAKRTADR